MAEKIVVALGGNALQSGKAEPTAEAQLRWCSKKISLVKVGSLTCLEHSSNTLRTR